jgi:hypothetical protein
MPGRRGVGSMRDTYELTRDGPYVRVVLPDVLPPDWDALEREIDDEIDDGATRIVVMSVDAGTLDTHGERLALIVSRLEDARIDAVVVRQDEPPLVGVG